MLEENPMEKGYTEHLSLDGRIILKGSEENVLGGC
jgi:hypothetical protein